MIEVTDELYFLQISCDIKESHNPHKQRTDNIKKILVSLKKELDDNKTYYDNNAISIDDVIRKIEAINEVIDVKNESVVRKNKVCSLIIKEIIDFNAECTSKSNTAEAKIRAQNKLTDEIIEKIADEIKLRRSVTDFPLMPNKVTSGESHNTEKGYVFQKIAKYYNADIKNELLSSLFNKGTSDLQIFEFNSTTDFLMLCNGFGQSRSKSITSFND
ncbi:hypothetical protein FACS1894166_02800 [Bacilli bacterium]|nr:hypothetical protein FACS1894166_02800 [Bacilli bacterium]